MKPPPRAFSREPVVAAPQNPAMATATQFPMTIEFQAMLLRMLLVDREFSGSMGKHIQPGYFSNNVHQWVWHQAISYRHAYGALPTVTWLLNLAYQQPQPIQPLFVAITDQIRSVVITDEQAVRSTAVDFVQRAIFRASWTDARDLFNSGNVTAAYDLVMTEQAKLRNVHVKSVPRMWLADTFVDRHIERQDVAQQALVISTGIPELDKILEGGAWPKFLGLWIAKPKAGKTTLLINFGAIAARTQRKRVVHYILEGNLEQISARYDTIFTEEIYGNVRRGHIDADKFIRARAEYEQLRGLIVLRDFTDGWDCNILNIHDDMEDLRRVYSWNPDLVLVDYLDLLKSRNSNVPKVEQQTEASQDLMNLANKGYAIWSASQVQRPDDDDEKDIPDVLHARQIADCYAKVRIASFIGSINQTRSEREQKVMRLYAELYRDNAADKLLHVSADFQKMRLGESAAQVHTNAAVSAPKPFGYGSLKQSHNGV